MAFNYFNPDAEPSEEELQAQRTAKAWAQAPQVGAGLGGLASLLSLIPGLEGAAKPLGAAGQAIGTLGGDLVQAIGGGQAQQTADQMELERQRRAQAFQAALMQHQEQQGLNQQDLENLIRAA